MVKRVFDIVLALLILSFFFWVLIICWIMAVLDTKSHGVFVQERIGQFGKTFSIYKLRTIRNKKTSDTKSISKSGKFLRSYRLDELPQLFNILKGEMSFVGPRPDIAGYYDLLTGEQRKILELKPGLTSAAALKYRHEAHFLATHASPLLYNDTVIFPDKVHLNLAYYHNHTISRDILIILKTVSLTFFKRNENA
jgi:lipopolysaccharide/colanic/teichoic acid biosynthesis glycosyltransferase